MAHTNCFNGHWLWNGDGKPEVNIYSVEYFKEFVKRHPNYRLDANDGTKWTGHIYDCYDESSEEELDGWYCKDCGAIAIFKNNKRYDYLPVDYFNIVYSDIVDWEDYIACNNDEFYEFMDFYIGMNPVEALTKFNFKVRYKLSPDKMIAYGYDEKKNIISCYKRIRLIYL